MASKVSGTQRRRQFSEAEKQRIVADAERLGVCAAARKHGVHQSNVSRWLAQARDRGTSTQRSGRDARRRGIAVPARSGEGGAKDEQIPQRTSALPSQQRAVIEAAFGRQTPAGTKRRVAKSYTPSQKAEAVEYAAEHGPTEAAEKFGMTRFSIYAWQRQVRKAAAGRGPSPTTGPAPTEIEQQRDKEILDEWKRHPGLGPSQIRNQLRRKSVKVSVNTVRRVMEDAGCRTPKVKRGAADGPAVYVAVGSQGPRYSFEISPASRRNDTKSFSVPS